MTSYQAYNPYPKHLAHLTKRLDSSVALQPINNFQKNQSRRRNSLSVRLSNPTHTASDYALKEKLMNEQLNNMESALQIQKSNHDKTILGNSEELRYLQNMSAQKRMQLNSIWQGQSRDARQRCLVMIESVLPSRHVVVQKRYPYQYQVMRRNQMQHLKRLEVLEAQYIRQTDLSRVTFTPQGRYY